MSIKCLKYYHRQYRNRFLLIKNASLSHSTKNKKMKENEEHTDIPVSRPHEIAINTPLYKSYKGYQLQIIYENDHFLVVNKPYDIKLEKGKFDNEYPSVETLIRQQKGIGVFRMCGQLDYATSGLLIIAKSKLVSNIINYNIECKNISKIYLAILYGHIPLHLLHVTVPICKVKNQFKMKLCYNYNNDYNETGKHCYSLIYPYKHSFMENEKVTLCEMRTITGRRHQLRLHSICIGSSIVGDETYFEDAAIRKYKIGTSDSEKKNQNVFRKIEAERMMLHCWIILNNKKKKEKLKKTKNVTDLEKEIFSENYIVGDDELSPFVNERKRVYEECVLKDDNLINHNFVNYNLYDINKNLRKINKKLNKENYDELLRNSLKGENNNTNDSASSEKAVPFVSKMDKILSHSKIEEEDKMKSKFLCNSQMKTLNVTDKKINKEQLDPFSIYKVQNDNYVNPNDLFDDIRDDINKFNWG